MMLHGVPQTVSCFLFCCYEIYKYFADYYLATAATNGHVCVWNLTKSGKAMQEQVYQEHKRTVNKVNFHASEPNKLISGSQDGTMRYFDIRVKHAVAIFYRWEINNLHCTKNDFKNFVVIQKVFEMYSLVLTFLIHLLLFRKMEVYSCGILDDLINVNSNLRRTVGLFLLVIGILKRLGSPLPAEIKL